MSVDLSITDGVAAIVLNDPPRRNALDRRTLRTLAELVGAAERAGAGVIVLSAEGPVFSAGADFNELTGTSADADYDAAVAATTATLRRSPIPVIAAVHGACLGAAVDLVVSTDVVIAARAARFEVPAVRIGILYNPASLSIIRGRLTSALMRQLMLGVSVSATDATAGGLVARVVDTDDLAEVTGHIARQIAGANRQAVAATKELLGALDTGTVDLDAWTPRRLRLLDSPERQHPMADRRRKEDPR